MFSAKTAKHFCHLFSHVHSTTLIGYLSNCVLNTNVYMHIYMHTYIYIHRCQYIYINCQYLFISTLIHISCGCTIQYNAIQWSVQMKMLKLFTLIPALFLTLSLSLFLLETRLSGSTLLLSMEIHLRIYSRISFLFNSFIRTFVR